MQKLVSFKPAFRVKSRPNIETENGDSNFQRIVVGKTSIFDLNYFRKARRTIFARRGELFSQGEATKKTSFLGTDLLKKRKSKSKIRIMNKQ
jgi:hypothetical protein